MLETEHTVGGSGTSGLAHKSLYILSWRSLGDQISGGIPPPGKGYGFVRSKSLALRERVVRWSIPAGVQGVGVGHSRTGSRGPAVRFLWPIVSPFFMYSAIRIFGKQCPKDQVLVRECVGEGGGRGRGRGCLAIFP